MCREAWFLQDRGAVSISKGFKGQAASAGASFISCLKGLEGK